MFVFPNYNEQQNAVKLQPSHRKKNEPNLQTHHKIVGNEGANTYATRSLHAEVGRLHNRKQTENSKCTPTGETYKEGL